MLHLQRSNNPLVMSSTTMMTTIMKMSKAKARKISKSMMLTRITPTKAWKATITTARRTAQATAMPLNSLFGKVNTISALFRAVRVDIGMLVTACLPSPRHLSIPIVSRCRTDHFLRSFFFLLCVYIVIYEYSLLSIVCDQK